MKLTILLAFWGIVLLGVRADYIEPYVGIFSERPICRCPDTNSTRKCDILGQCECFSGLHGKSCTRVCNCSNPYLNICDPYDGDCGCLFDFATNPNCLKKCPCHAEQTRSCFVGRCLCEDGYFGPRCEQRCDCSDNSVSLHCGSRGSCDCLPGYYGKKCNQVCNCSLNSYSSVCNTHGSCSCRNGWTGKNCDKACNCHTNGTVRQKCNHMGYCHCKHGYTGKLCDQECLCHAAHSRDGVCDPFGYCKCLPNFYGRKCENECRCRNIRPRASCDHLGNCPCLSTHYGKDCTNECDCIHSDTQLCDFKGRCLCKDGFYGRNCNLSCNYCHNQTSNGKCDTNGFCNCLTGFYGKSCAYVEGHCGKIYMPDWYTNKKARIVNGMTAEHPVPWIVHIILRDIYVCSGVILNKFWVLTLSGCFIKTEEVSQILIKAGDYNLLHYDITESLYVVDLMRISQPHPDQDFRLALLRIRTNEGYGFHWNSAVAPICLNPEIRSYDGHDIFLAGWGFMNNYEMAPILQTAILSFTDPAECTVNTYLDREREIICAKHFNLTSFTCIEEPGNPLSVIVDDIHYLIGLFLTGSKNCNIPGLAVFANIYHFHDWIYRNII